MVTHINETGEDHDIHFKPSWPPVIVHVHPANSYGARFPALPKLPSTYLDTRILWSLLAMTCLVSEIWEHVSSTVESTKDWQGWILHFATWKCVLACSGRGRKTIHLASCTHMNHSLKNILVQTSTTRQICYHCFQQLKQWKSADCLICTVLET